MAETKKVNYIPTKKDADDDFENFVGIIYNYLNNDGIDIYYPFTLGKIDVLDFKERKLLIFKLIKSLKLCENDKRITKDNGNIRNGNFPFISYLWIWDDYKQNGRLVSFEIQDSRMASGKINWKKTFQGQPFYYKNNIYYNDLYYKKKTIYENLLTEIYDYCVYKSLEMIYFLTNISSNIIHPLHKNLKGKKNEYINCLNEALLNTFDDEKKLRYRHMLNVINSESYNSITKKQIVGAKYHYVYEKQIDMMLSNVKNINEYYPPAANYAFKGVKHKDGKTISQLRPDTIYKDDDGGNIFIYDSKFYEFGNLPGADSIGKQIIYGEYIEKEKGYNADNIYNVFIIPKKLDKKPFEYQGYSAFSWKKQNKTYEIILNYYIDFRYVLENYNKGFNSDLSKKLNEDIKKRINSIKKI